MKLTPLVSVIIPVFNGLNFLRDAVESAVHQKAVGEIIIVDDGSSDGSLILAEELSFKSPKIRLYSHENNKNKGVSASRNLGIEKAQFEWISFLDADDGYLPNRFDSFIQKVNSGDKFDGIYQLVTLSNSGKIFGISKTLPSEKLFRNLLRGTYGHFHTNSIVVRKSSLVAQGMFNTELEVHEDSMLWLKLALIVKLIPGDISNPVAVFMEHNGNRLTKKIDTRSRLKFWKAVMNWSISQKMSLIDRFLIIRKVLRYSF